MSVGWDPMVTSVMTSYDGGKVIAGFGKITSTLYNGWLIKMWGTVGTLKCNTNAAISGYVQMAYILNTALTTAADCNLSANAKVQWAWTSYTAGSGISATVNAAYVVFMVSEDWKWGLSGTVATAGDDPVYHLVGGATNGNTASWGLLSWQPWLVFINMDGVAPTTGDGFCTACSISSSLNSPNMRLANNEIYWKADAGDDTYTKILTDTNSITNGCWTIVSSWVNAAAATLNMAIGGIFSSAHTCL